MKQHERVQIEDSILKITKELLHEWEDKFQRISIYNDVPFINRNDCQSQYFSEIEVNFWYNTNSLASVFSIIIFMQNKQVLNVDDAKIYIDREIEYSYRECIGTEV